MRRIKITYPILLAFFNERKKDKKDVAAAEIYEWLRCVDALGCQECKRVQVGVGAHSCSSAYVRCMCVRDCVPVLD